ncbi:hypothetical protein V6N12_058190 [Hibiscus sabdariffa]|uniref:Uncharacterized protein n=1 Tax=Hibiscus sabdariffa TaxID=183260 RepID=A0ABR2ERG1_9ROSI
MAPKKKNVVAKSVPIEQASEPTLEYKVKIKGLEKASTSLEERVGKLEASDDVAKETQGLFESRLVKMESMEDQFKDEMRRILNELESVRESNAGEAEVKALWIEVDELKKELLSCKVAMSEWGELKPFLEELRPGVRLTMEQVIARI